MDLIVAPAVGTWVMVFMWFLGTPAERKVVEPLEIYSLEECDALAEEQIAKFKRKDLGIVCQFIPGLPV